jgi:ABC-type polysaccharide/polyol phosphate export permease
MEGRLGLAISFAGAHRGSILATLMYASDRIVEKIGPLWWLVLQPLIYLLVYYVVFNEFLASRVSSVECLKENRTFFPLAMFCGLVPWIAINEALARGAGCVIENGSLIKKFAFPSEILPAYLVGVSLVNTLIGFGLLGTAVFIIDGEVPHHPEIIPILLLLQAVFTLGLVFLFAGATVFVRDIGHMLPMALNFWMFLSPIFFFAKFPSTSLLSRILCWNPVTYLIEPWRSVFVAHPAIIDGWRAEMAGRIAKGEAGIETVALPPGDPSAAPWREIGIFAVVAFLVLIVGYRSFMALKPRFADEV